MTEDKLKSIEEYARTLPNPIFAMDVEQLVAEVRRLCGLYDELILAVARKHPSESRHETARRYIREREAPSTQAHAVAVNAEPSNYRLHPAVAALIPPSD